MSDEIASLIALRHDLHRMPELSGAETRTAQRIAAEMAALGADEIATGIGGTGVIATFHSGAAGPRVMFRAELDALPIEETGSPAHRSTISGRGHLCGHDGHMAVLVGLGRRLRARPPRQGSVALLFQPAEETGAGAAAMLADARMQAHGFDYGFALHNMPGVAQGRALIRAGVMSCASIGMAVRLTGATSHASEPEKARSPALALSRLIPALGALSSGDVARDDFRLLTLTHLRMGEPAFGITPGAAEICATLRSTTDEGLASLRAEAVALCRAEAAAERLEIGFDWHDGFAATVNDLEAARLLAVAAQTAGIETTETGLPMRASEDFGRFGSVMRSAMILLGAGEDHPALHAGDYDFPDALIGQGVEMFDQLRRGLTG
ncbi:MAG: amidohydrolase [Paracoccus sp. (in: a-proteobacteria)]|nr:amidohydrolase [Paracoccus sp. (in: a-proteobacteria)]